MISNFQEINFKSNVFVLSWECYNDHNAVHSKNSKIIYVKSRPIICISNIILVRIIIPIMKHQGKKASWRKKGLFCLHFQNTIVHHWRKSGRVLKQGKNLEAGADTEPMEEHWLLEFSLWLVLLSFRVQHY